MRTILLRGSVPGSSSAASFVANFSALKLLQEFGNLLDWPSRIRVCRVNCRSHIHCTFQSQTKFFVPTVRLYCRCQKLLESPVRNNAIYSRGKLVAWQLGMHCLLLLDSLIISSAADCIIKSYGDTGHRESEYSFLPYLWRYLLRNSSPY